MLAIGGFTPLDGFMTRADWEGVCDNYRTAAGVFWPIPITLSVDAASASDSRAAKTSRSSIPTTATRSP